MSLLFTCLPLRIKAGFDLLIIEVVIIINPSLDLDARERVKRQANVTFAVLVAMSRC